MARSEADILQWSEPGRAASLSCRRQAGEQGPKTTHRGSLRGDQDRGFQAEPAAARHVHLGLTQAMLHMLKAEAGPHWQAEARQSAATPADRFAPSMRREDQRIDMAKLHRPGAAHGAGDDDDDGLTTAPDHDTAPDQNIDRTYGLSCKGRRGSEVPQNEATGVYRSGLLCAIRSAASNIEGDGDDVQAHASSLAGNCGIAASFRRTSSWLHRAAAASVQLGL